MSETYKVTDAAKRMGIAPETLRTMLVRKELPFGVTHRMPSGRRIYRREHRTLSAVHAAAV